MSAISCDARGVLIPCPGCGGRARIAHAALARANRCGACHADLPAPASPVEVPDEEAFTALTAGAALPVLVDFWAPWCGPCRMVAPEVERLAGTVAGRVVVAKVDTEQLPGLAGRLGIASIPTFAVFHHGRELGRTAGGMGATQLGQFVHSCLSGRRQG